MRLTAARLHALLFMRLFILFLKDGDYFLIPFCDRPHVVLVGAGCLPFRFQDTLPDEHCSH